MLSNVTVTRSEKVKDELILEGNDIELVSRSAALINQVPFLFLFCILGTVLCSSICLVVIRNGFTISDQGN
jgi:hypothetical protein